jgi:opacity protein-like surface antigen
MGDKPYDIENVFKDAIDGLEAEPSEHFWVKANEDILNRENSVYRKRINTWKGIAASLGVVVVVLLIYLFNSNDNTETKDKQVSKVEQQQNNNPVESENNEKKIENRIVLSKTNLAKEDLKSNNNQTQLESKEVSINKDISKVSSDNPEIKLNKVDENNNFIKEVHPTIKTDSISINNDSKISPKINNSSEITAPKYKSPDSISMDTLTLAKNNLDTVGNHKPSDYSYASKDVLSNLSISAYFAPNIKMELLKDNDGHDNETIKKVRSRQGEKFSYTTGLRIGYDISDRWSLHTGLEYHASSFSISPTVIYGQQNENGAVGYSLITSSGTVNIPFYPQPNIGDSIKVRGTSTRDYISIPLLAQFAVLSGRILDFYASGGLTINFAKNKTTDIHWENTQLQEGEVSINEINGLNTTNYSYSIGLGLKYHLSKGFSIYAEPSFQGAITSINSNTPITTYSYYLGLAGGANYHF